MHLIDSPKALNRGVQKACVASETVGLVFHSYETRMGQNRLGLLSISRQAA